MDSLRGVLAAGQASPAFFPFSLHIAVLSFSAPLSLPAVKQPLVPQLARSELAQVPLMALNYVFETEPVDFKIYYQSAKKLHLVVSIISVIVTHLWGKVTLLHLSCALLK